MNFVLLTRLFEMTGSSLATTLLWLAYALPSVLFGPLAGAVVDAWDRKGLLMAANLIRSGVVLWLAFNGQATIIFIYGVVLVYSSLTQFYVPAEIASLPTLLPPESYARATGFFIITQQAAMLVGFSMGGSLIHFLGFSQTLGLCAGMLILAFVCVLFLPSMKAAPAFSSSSSSVSTTFRQAVGRGFMFLKGERAVLAPFLLLLFSQGGMATIIVGVPAIATDLFRVTARLAGLAVVAPFAAGTLIGAALVPKLLAVGWRKKRVVEASLLMMGVFLAMLISALPEIQGWPRIASGAVISLGFGLAFIGIVIPSQTMIQERTPEGLRGRVFGNLSVLANVLAIVPVLFSGTVAQLLGVRFPLGFLGLSCLTGLFLSRRHGNRIFRMIGGEKTARLRDSFPAAAARKGLPTLPVGIQENEVKP